MKKHKSHQTGEVGENTASRYLRRHGYSIIARNYKTKIGELDIIATKGRTLVFIEVKTRTSNWMAMPYEYVDANKQKKLRNLANGFLAYGGIDRLGDHFRDIRFDVISVNLDKLDSLTDIEHIKGAFE